LSMYFFRPFREPLSCDRKAINYSCQHGENLVNATRGGTESLGGTGLGTVGAAVCCVTAVARSLPGPF
jgi:hypothetical protein